MTIVMKRILVFLLPLWLMAACGNNANNNDIDVDLISNPNSAAGFDDAAPMPKIVFDCNNHDFGRLSEGESVSYSFHFRNQGNADLVISGCSASCGCTVADYPRNRIAPGKEGYVVVTFNSHGKEGQQFQEVTVHSNTQPAATRLTIVSQVSR